MNNGLILQQKSYLRNVPSEIIPTTFSYWHSSASARHREDNAIFYQTYKSLVPLRLIVTYRPKSFGLRGYLSLIYECYQDRDPYCN